MHVEIVLAALVMVVAVLVAADFFRRTSDAPHEYPAGNEPGPTPDAGRDAYPASRAGSVALHSSSPPSEPAAAAPTAGARQDGARQDGARQDGARQASGAGTPVPSPSLSPDPGGPRTNWLVRTRLCLLAVVSAAAAALATASFIRAVGAFQRASADSNVSSMRDGAIASAILALLFAGVILAVGLCSALILIRSVLRPLRQLRTGAVELTEVWLPDALRDISVGHISRTDGQGRPLAVKAVGVSALDEIGDVARAFDQVQGEVLRLADNEAGLRGKLSEMFTELSGRGQTLMEHQLRLIDELGQTEPDAGRRASLVTMNHLATRMRRYSQNLLVLAGHELPGRWNQPVMLADVIRAAVAQTGEYERVSVSVQPDIAVSGPAVIDVVHLIAELAENAASLSAADTPVDISGGALVTGGVLIEVTDQGVGMNPDMMAQANWRLENPPPVDVAVSRNMGLFVVGKLAMRHGAKVRLQPAATGGLTALVWLPDAVIVLPEAGGAASPGPAEPDTMASSTRPAPTPEDARTLQPAALGPSATPGPSATQALSATPGPSATQALSATPGLSAGPGLRPRHARPALRLRAAIQLPASRQAFSWSETPARSQPAESSQPADEQAPGEQAPGEQGPEDPSGQRRLPIYEAVESDWFSSYGQRTDGAAVAGAGWGAAADSGWDAAKTVLAPASSGVTTSGLPVRTPRANLVPGAAGRPPSGGSGPAGAGDPAGAAGPARSADAIRNRLAGFQQGASRGRAAAGGGQDETG
ncbi:MAG TPA: ATP-binding protein [Streptosporangiaceae bacterium]|nr:ATP-binding protein [Streptosporangiaceae bacterium]